MNISPPNNSLKEAILPSFYNSIRFVWVTAKYTVWAPHIGNVLLQSYINTQILSPAPFLRHMFPWCTLWERRPGVEECIIASLMHNDHAPRLSLPLFPACEGRLPTNYQWMIARRIQGCTVGLKCITECIDLHTHTHTRMCLGLLIWFVTSCGCCCCCCGFGSQG